MERPDYDSYFMQIAEIVAKRSTCIKKKVGAVLISPENRILSTGYNGTPEGVPHCSEHWESEAEMRQSHRLWSEQNEIHAETNAIRYALKALPKKEEKKGEKIPLMWRLLSCVSVNPSVVNFPTQDLRGCTIYTTYAPCMRCAQTIIDHGIAKVVYKEENLRYLRHVEEMFRERKIEMVNFNLKRKESLREFLVEKKWE